MRRFSANYIIPVVGNIIKNGIVEVDHDGRIAKIIKPSADFEEIHSTEFYNGVIVPGFVNAHCHLELSHLKGAFKSGLGLPEFVEQIGSLRISSVDEIQNSIKIAMRDLQCEGIVAVGDICNCTHSIVQKQCTGIHFHNFIELFDIDSSLAQPTFAKQMEVYAKFKYCFPESTSIAAHAPYTVSDSLWHLIRNHLYTTTSIHFAECESEYDLIQRKKGVFFARYNGTFKGYSVPEGGSPMELIMRNIPKDCKPLLVHCTYASGEELLQLKNYYKEVTFVTCPESNLFIENAMADLSLMKKLNLNIAIGTDSLASATTLSMLHNIKLILSRFSDITFIDALQWATMNGARALNIANKYGSIEVGKCPGLNLITNFNFNKMCPTNESTVKKLI